MSRRSTSKRTGSLSRDDWIDAAYQVIATRGVDAVAVEPLAQQLGVTKGSFYWHFPNRNALLVATLERWERQATEATIAQVEQIPDPRERLMRLFERASAMGDSLGDGDNHTKQMPVARAFELALADAARDPIVGPILRRVVERRIDYLEDCFRALGMQPDEARSRALLSYAATVGLQRLLREVPTRIPRGEDYRSFQRRAISTLLPDPTAS